MYANRNRNKFAANLSESQMKLARRMQEAGLDTISQIVKAFERHDDKRIAELKEQLKAHDEKNGRAWS